MVPLNLLAPGICGSNFQDIKNNAGVTWITIFVTSEAIRQSLPNRLTSDKKSLFTVTNVLFQFLHAIYILNTHFR